MSSALPSTTARERFFFLGTGLLVAAALVVGLAREQQWGARFITFQLLSRNAEGLRSGQDVRISGLPVGTVKTLQLQPDAQVKVVLAVQERYARLIGPRSVASLGQEGLVGDHFLVISADPQPAGAGNTLQPRQLAYQQPLAINNLMHRLVATQEELQRTLENTTRLTQQALPNTLGNVNRLALTLNRETTATTPALRQTLEQISRTGNSAEQTSRQAQQLLLQSQPLLLSTMRDLAAVADSSHRILKALQQLLGLEQSAEPAQGSDSAADPVCAPPCSPANQ